MISWGCAPLNPTDERISISKVLSINQGSRKVLEAEGFIDSRGHQLVTFVSDRGELKRLRDITKTVATRNDAKRMF